MIKLPKITSRRWGTRLARSATLRKRPPEDFEHPAGHDRQQRNEDRAKDRPEHRAEAADDHHRQIVDGDIELELLVIGDPQIVAFQDAGHAGIERRDRERVELVAEDIDADDLGGDVSVADGDKGAADTAANQVLGANYGQNYEKH